MDLGSPSVFIYRPYSNKVNFLLSHKRSKTLLKVSSYPTLLWRLECGDFVIFDDYISKGWLPGPKNTFLGGKTCKRLLKKIYISKKQMKIYNYKFSKANVLKNGKRGTGGKKPV